MDLVVDDIELISYIKLMLNKSSVRSTNRDNFKRCIELRKQGLSYSEIMRQVPIAKSTLNNWLALAGLTLTAEHLNIQRTKRLQNHVIATEASRITRAKKAELEIRNSVQKYKNFLNDPFFVGGIMLYEAEGSKGNCTFSNSDYRVIQMFVIFMERYFLLDRMKNMRFRLYIHEIRKMDLKRIKSFWAKKLDIPGSVIVLSWKRNIVTRQRENLNYVGQLSVSILGVSYLARKLQFLSSIIFKKYCRIV